MASSMPEIGSKISLISKADIRYEGKLFTVDPSECTIALSHVRSFGTEDRQAQYPVPAQSQIYEYILFRGSDIKDISIINQQLPNDPAIVSGGMAPGGLTATQNYAVNGLSQPTMYQGGPHYMAPGMGRFSKPMSSELLPPLGPPQAIGAPTAAVILHPGPEMQVQVPVLPQVQVPVCIKEPNELLAGSRSSTPGPSQRKSPTIDQCTQVSPHKYKKVTEPPVPRDGRQNRNYQENYQRRDYRNPRDDYRGQRDNRDDYRGQRDNRDDYRGQRDNRDNEYRGQRDMDHRRQHDQQDKRRDQHVYQNSVQRGPLHQQQQNHQGRGGWVPRGGRGGNGGLPNLRSNRGRGGGPGGNFNRAPGTGTGQQQNNPNAAKKNTLKFEEEYDFDKANSEFEELRSKTAKLKISGEVEVEKPKVNGEDKKDDSGNETGLGENEHEEEADPDSVIYYDKAKSFFDNISCEAIERSKGRSQRTDWRTERKLNSETFGVASARRGSYRGRGGYYGGRGLYRGYRGYNNRGQNQNNRGPHINQPKPALATSTVAVAGK